MVVERLQFVAVRCTAADSVGPLSTGSDIRARPLDETCPFVEA